MTQEQAKELVESALRRAPYSGLSRFEQVAVRLRAAGASDAHIAAALCKDRRAIPALLANARHKALAEERTVAGDVLAAFKGRRERDPYTFADPRGPKPDGTPRPDLTIPNDAPAEDEKARVHASVHPSVRDLERPLREAFATIGA